MDKFIDVIVDGILSNFDFGFMFIVNVLTYIVIKVIDYLTVIIKFLLGKNDVY